MKASATMNRSIIPFPPGGAQGESRHVSASAAFDESQFMPWPAFRDEYYASVARGYDRMRRLRVVIGGLARDIEHVLPQTIARVERLGQFFDDYRVVVYENDSHDQTLAMLTRWREWNSRVLVVSEQRNDPVNLPSRCLSRAARMAYYRGECQRVIRESYSQFDHVILVDTDLLGGWSYDGVAHTFGQRDWDFVGANGFIYRRRWLSPNAVSHYDAWAFRNDQQFTPLTTKEVNGMIFHRGQPMERVYSCFGGLGIYRMPAYLAGRYDGTDVEHVTFHRVLHERGFDKTYLNPSLITVYGRKHRSLDAWAARMIRILDLWPRRRSTTWNFAMTKATPSSRHERGKQAA
jgi:hypothetical protein